MKSVWRPGRVLFGRAAALVVALMLAGSPAVADIKSFNAAMKDRDYARATAAAASAWQTLDKSREDLPIIAREFGFAAYMAGDFAAARTYATGALNESGDTPEAAASRVQSTVLLRAAEHRAGPTDQTRNALVQALQARAAVPGLDGISFLASQAAANYDFGKARWAPALESSGVAKTLAEAGGPAYRVPALRFDMVQAAALHATSADALGYERLDALRKLLIREIDNAASDAAAQVFVPLYWEVAAWSNAARGIARNRQNTQSNTVGAASTMGTADSAAGDARSKRLLYLDPDGPCKVRPDPGELPRARKFEGDERFSASVVIVLDIDEKGKIFNVRSLASVPDAAMGQALADFLSKDKRWKMTRDGDWGPSCSLARSNYSFAWIFGRQPPWAPRDYCPAAGRAAPRNAASCAIAAFSSSARAVGAQRGSVFWIARAITGVTGIGRQPCVCSQIMSHFVAAGAWQERQLPPNWFTTCVVPRTRILVGWPGFTSSSKNSQSFVAAS